MLRITEIVEKKNSILLCKFNTGEVKSLNVLPIIENHKNIKGVEKLLDNSIFKTAQIGQFGEIYWPKLITSSHNNEEVVWNYDISPEYAYYNSF